MIALPRPRRAAIALALFLAAVAALGAAYVVDGPAVDALLFGSCAGCHA